MKIKKTYKLVMNGGVKNENCTPVPINFPENKWIIYGRHTCPYTMQAKEELEEKGYDFEFVDILQYIKDNKEKEKFKDCMSKYTNNHRKFPMVFFGKEWIGGYSDLNNIIKNNKKRCLNYNDYKNKKLIL